jgi:internalin A
MVTPDWVLEKIAEAKEFQDRDLDLSRWMNGGKTTAFPPEILELENLETLNFAGQTGIKLPVYFTQLNQLKAVNLCDCGLNTIPEILSQLPCLDALLLSKNKIVQFPDWVARRTNWRILKLAELNLSAVPEWIKNQPNLEELDLSNNVFEDNLGWLVGLPNLRILRVDGNRIYDWPEAVNSLKNLEELDLSVTGITKVPKSIKKIKNLKRLYLDGNGIAELPETFSSLTNLDLLSLRANSLDHIPDCIFDLASLEFLSFNNLSTSLFERHKLEVRYKNTITEVPPAIQRLELLLVLLLNGNNVTTPPLEVLQKGVKAIREYFRQVETQGVDHLYEAKLLIVGEPGAGKTTLAHKLQDPDYVLQDQEKSTQGINIGHWSFPIESGHEFRVNIWDFGGQEIYHATHQYFLTKRSLYLLVADMRQEDTDFEYWLNVVELLSNGSPTLIIKNEKQDRHRELDERMLRGRFENLKETLATNLSTNRGLDKIQEAIQHYLRQLPHIGSSLPKTWVKVRNALENDPRNYISLLEYLQICEHNGFQNQADKLQLSGYLHDLGVCLHFQDDPVLKNIVILKPQWGTAAAYQVLDNSTVIANLGCFSTADLKTIWNQQEYTDMHDELLHLMMKFRLCYKIPEMKNRYIAPQLLGVQKPDYEWNDRENLYLRYRYDFMPKGILTLFIVAMHEDIAGHNLVWRNGVVLEDLRGHARAEVIEYYNNREIKIRVSGALKKDLLAVVSHEMDKIHRSYPGLKYITLIPCNCSTCKIDSNPHFYTLDTLNHFLEERQELIQCQRSFEMINVRSLIDDVFPPRPTMHFNDMGDSPRVQIIMPDGKINLNLAQEIDNRNIRTGGAYVEGNVSTQGDFVGRDQNKITFPVIFKDIEGSITINPEKKRKAHETIHSIEEELKEAGDEPNEGFLTRRFKTLVSVAPEIVDLVLAAAVSPDSGFSEAAQKIVKKAAGQSRGDEAKK